MAEGRPHKNLNSVVDYASPTPAPDIPTPDERAALHAQLPYTTHMPLAIHQHAASPWKIRCPNTTPRICTDPAVVHSRAQHTADATSHCHDAPRTHAWVQQGEGGGRHLMLRASAGKSVGHCDYEVCDYQLKPLQPAGACRGV
jgi:hypothetical protein